MEIQIFGETLTIKHNMKVQLAYEQMTDTGFDLADMTKAERRMALYMATILACNPDTQITMDNLLEADIDTIATIDKAVNRAVSEWYKIPAATNDPALTEEHTEAEKKV